jgi:hypothetical protein
VYSYCTHGYLAFLKKKTLHIYKLSETRDEASFNETYPVDYFGIREYTSDVRINPWNSSVVMKTSNSSVHLFDFRSAFKPTCLQFYLKPHIDEVSSLDIINWGRGLAGVFGQELDFYSMVARTAQKSFHFGSPISAISYDFASNSLILIFNERQGLALNCADPSERRLLEFPPHFEKRLRLPNRTGIGILALVHFNSIEFFDVKANFGSREVLSLPQKYIDAGFWFIQNFRLSNIVQLARRTQAPATYQVKFLWLRGSKELYCHSSCKGECKVPFLPCSARLSIVLAMLSAALLTTLLVVLCFVYATWLEKEQPQRLRRGNANLSVIVQSSLAASERNSLAAGFQGRSVPLYLRASGGEKLSRDHSLFLIEEEPILPESANLTNLDLSQASEKEEMTL